MSEPITKAVLYYSGFEISVNESAKALSVMGELLQEFGVTSFELHLVDIDKNPEMVEADGIPAVPALRIFIAGEESQSLIVGNFAELRDEIISALRLPQLKA